MANEKVKNDNPLVSIIIPVYNGSNFLSRAVDSALNQTYKNTEIIVVNDGSKDNGATEKIALSYGDKIRYFYKENGGVSTALNFGIENMRGEYFSWLSHDDEYEADKIEREVKEILNSEEDTIVFCSLNLIDENSAIINSKFNFGVKDGQNISPKDMIVKILQKSLVNGCATLIPKKLFKDLKFNVSHKYVQDFEMWIDACIKGYSWKFIDYKGVRSRVHKNQLTYTGKKIFVSDCASWADRVAEKIAEIDEKEYKLSYNFAAYFKKYGAYLAAKKMIKTAKKYKRISISDSLKLFIMGIYGGIRPLIRKLYYALVRSN